MQSPLTDIFAFGAWIDDEQETELSAEIFEVKKRKLLERIKEHQLSESGVKPKRSKKGGAPQIVKQEVKVTESQVVIPLSTPSFKQHQDEDAICEAQFRRHLLPRIPPSIRCDNMADFPTAFTNCLNSGNNEGLGDLVRSSLDHQCDIRILSGAGSLSCGSFFKFFELMNEIHPDRIICVNTTNVVNNQVTAALYMKYTDCKSLYQAVARTVTDPSLFRIVPATRAQYIAARIQPQFQSEEDQQKLINLVESDFDLVVYGCVYVTMTFDDVTRKATALQMAGNLTSAHVADVTQS
eukprot:CAMPEP_0184971132 /NCGR_PEP_ID=MMETSP1098-20130426/3417_1 /TAXON_ID=89044 /ORGANISM="Spumella elongata, Strain CCAP 955/1" /LENGTH=294 /DNA_ID=CAMNT_0027493185 /DNA_START=50 /DNA_END=934 /DNA_ORIENTATION=-